MEYSVCEKAKNARRPGGCKVRNARIEGREGGARLRRDQREYGTRAPGPSAAPQRHQGPLKDGRAMLTSTTNSATGPQLIPFRFGRFCRMEWAFMQLASESSDDELDGDGGAEKTTSRVVPPRVGMRGWALLACFYFVGVTGSKRPESILAGRLAASAFGRGWLATAPARPRVERLPSSPTFQKADGSSLSVSL